MRTRTRICRRNVYGILDAGLQDQITLEFGGPPMGLGWLVDGFSVFNTALLLGASGPFTGSNVLVYTPGESLDVPYVPLLASAFNIAGTGTSPHPAAINYPEQLLALVTVVNAGQGPTFVGSAIALNVTVTSFDAEPGIAPDDGLGVPY